MSLFRTDPLNSCYSYGLRFVKFKSTIFVYMQQSHKVSVLYLTSSAYSIKTLAQPTLQKIAILFKYPIPSIKLSDYPVQPTVLSSTGPNLAHYLLHYRPLSKNYLRSKIQIYFILSKGHLIISQAVLSQFRESLITVNSILQATIQNIGYIKKK